MTTKIEIPKQDMAKITLHVKGLTPFISHRMNENFRETKSIKKELTPKDLDIIYGRTLYLTHDKKIPGIPAAAFSKCGEESAKGKGWWTGSDIDGKKFKGGVQVIGQVLPLVGKGLKETRRVDVVRVGRGAPDIRYRMSFENWECSIPLIINLNLMSVENVLKVFAVAGTAIGVGDWRPQRSGTFGMFELIGVE